MAEKLIDSLVEPFPSGTPRDHPGRALMLPNKATAVVGMRRAGKTTFLHQLRAERGLPRERLPFLNFEDERLSGLQAEDLHLLPEDYYRRYPALRGREVVLWCLDEIQVVPGWERFVRRLLDTEKVEVLLSGSSAALLSRELATAMRGRGWEVVLHPFSFREYLRHRGEETSISLGSRQRSIIEAAFLDYLTRGGFPEAQALDTRTRFQLLRDYVDVAILRDVVERHRVANVVGLRWLVRHLLANAAGSFSIEKFHGAMKSQGIAISRDTVHHLLAYLEDCFLVRTVWVEADSERRRMVNPRKCYPVDPGLIPVFDRSGRANLGHALETAVLLELERRGQDVTYVRTPEGLEVDLLARDPEGRAELIQVCADASHPPTAERELRALEAASRLHPEAGLRLFTATRDGLPRDLPAGVTARPAYEWMLNLHSP